jgi:uncharacterized membrane protein (UPF0127 family)
MIKKIYISNNLFNAKFVYNTLDVANGMMYSHFDRYFNAMFFILNEYKNQNFWMKNCIIPLDIIFLDDKLKITKIYHFCLPCNSNYLKEDNNCSMYEGMGKYAIEIEGGTCKRLNISENEFVSII